MGEMIMKNNISTVNELINEFNSLKEQFNNFNSYKREMTKKLKVLIQSSIDLSVYKKDNTIKNLIMLFEYEKYKELKGIKKSSSEYQSLLKLWLISNPVGINIPMYTSDIKALIQSMGVKPEYIEQTITNWYDIISFLIIEMKRSRKYNEVF
jgi:hypothetical protein